MSAGEVHRDSLMCQAETRDECDRDAHWQRVSAREGRTDSYRPMFGEAVAPWHRHFAWRPVDTIDRGWCWLKPVWRRRITKHDYLDGGPDFWWQHAVDLPADTPCEVTR